MTQFHALLYLSRQKLNHELSLLSRIQLDGRKIQEVAGGFSQVNGKVVLTQPEPQIAEQHHEMKRLGKVVSYLKKNYPQDASCPHLKANHWFSFDMPMCSYATLHEDGGRLPDDVAVFAGTSEQTYDGKPVNVLLCGSIKHLRTRCESAGRMGSDTTWLHDLMLEINNREEQGLTTVPECPEDLVPKSSLAGLDEIGSWVHRIITDEHPLEQVGHLRGYARVLHISAPDELCERLVLATPLYVEGSPPPRRKRGIRDRLASRLMPTSGGA